MILLSLCISSYVIFIHGFQLISYSKFKSIEKAKTCQSTSIEMSPFYLEIYDKNFKPFLKEYETVCSYNAMKSRVLYLTNICYPKDTDLNIKGFVITILHVWCL